MLNLVMLRLISSMNSFGRDLNKRGKHIIIVYHTCSWLSKIISASVHTAQVSVQNTETSYCQQSIFLKCLTF